MNINPKLNALFKPVPLRPATIMDRTTAAAREITEASARARAERTARLRATRLEREAFSAPPQPAKKTAAKRKSSKA